MPIYARSLQVNYLAFTAIFFFIGLGFLFMKIVHKKEVGPGYWAVAFFLNATGFILWSGIIPLSTKQYFLLGEIFHFSGFNLLIYGVYRFTGYIFKKWNIFFWIIITIAWIIPITFFTTYPTFSVIYLRILKSSLFFLAGLIIFIKIPKKEIRGKRLAGISFILWSFYNLIYGFVQVELLMDLVFGVLVGFQVLSSFGLVVMVTNRISIETEEKEEKILQLEKLLPICAYCKKIRDQDNSWQNIESYIAARTSSQFSHGICPECMEKYFPEHEKGK